MRRLVLTAAALLALLVGSAAPAFAGGHNPVCTTARDAVAGTAGVAGVALGCELAP